MVVRTFLEVLRGGVDELQGYKLETATLESTDDVSNDASLDTIGL